ncbi:MAG: ATP-binding protein [Thermaurantimonas sp.]
MTYIDSLEQFYEPHDILKSFRENILGHYCFRLEKYHESELYFKKSLEIARRYSEEFLDYLTYTLNNASSVANKLLKFDDATSYVIEIIYHTQKTNSSSSLDNASRLYQLGNILYNQEKYFESIDFLMESIKSLDTPEMTDNINAFNIVSMKFHINKLLSNAYIHLYIYDSAIVALNRASIFIDSMYKIDSSNTQYAALSEADLKYGYAKIFVEKGMYQKADSILHHLFANTPNVKNFRTRIQFRSASLLALSYLKQNKVPEALKIIDSLEQKSKDILATKNKITAEFFEIKSAVCARISDYKCSYISKFTSDAILDSISRTIMLNNTINTTRQYMNLLNKISEEKYHLNLKENRYTLAISFVISFGLLLFIYILYRQSERNKLYLKKEQELANELKKINSELTETNLKLSESQLYNKFLLKHMAHDLRNPISSIKGLAEILLNEQHLNESKTYLELIRIEAQHSLEFISNLLKSSSTSTEKNIHNLRSIIESSISTNIQQANAKNIRIQKEISEDIYCYADYYKIWSLLNNLIGNAIKFSYRNSVITILAAKKPNYVEISVSDQGVGISPSDLKKILSDESLDGRLGTEGEKSNGIGLRICKQIIREHKGDLLVSSKEGEGSTFTVILQCDEPNDTKSRKID